MDFMHQTVVSVIDVLAGGRLGLGISAGSRPVRLNLVGRVAGGEVTWEGCQPRVRDKCQ